MHMTSDFRPKRFKAYRIPEKLKPAVSAEIQRLHLGFIKPIGSPQASTLICIMKGKTIEDGIRLAVVSAHTVDCHQP